MIKIENWSTEDIEKYSRLIGKHLPHLPESQKRFHMMTSSNLSRSLLNSITGWVRYIQPPKNMKASSHTGIRIPDSPSDLLCI